MGEMVELWPGVRFIRCLPDPRGGWAPFVQVTISATGNYRTFVQQCRSNTLTHPASRDGNHQRSALGQTLAWHRYAHYYYRLAMSFYLYNLIKYRVLALIGRDGLLDGHFQHVDCLLLGRFRYLGRTNKIGDQISSVFFLWFFIYRLLIHVRVPKFKFFMFEFLMASREEVERCELQADPSGALVVPLNDQKLQPTTAMSTTTSSYENKFISLGNNQSLDQVNSLFYLRNQFNPNVTNRWILRPNRTTESWLALTLVFKLMCYWSLGSFGFCILVMYWAIGGSVLTNFGFEMSYPTCVAWLRDLQSTRHDISLLSSDIITPIFNLSQIYLAPEKLAHELCIDDVPARIQFNAQDVYQATEYSLIRIIFDVLENHLIYSEYVLLFIALFVTLVIQSIDVILNATAIKKRLHSLIAKLEARREHGRGIDIQCENRQIIYTKLIEASTRYAYVDYKSPEKSSSLKAHHHQDYLQRRRCQPMRRKFSSVMCPLTTTTQTSIISKQDLPSQGAPLSGFNLNPDYLDNSNYDEHLNEEICNLQAILVDHFDTITRGYNKFVSYLIGLLGLCWLHYTLVVCNWMGAIRSHAVEFEFVLAESNITWSCMIYLSGAALIRSRNMQLYPLIARAMALELDLSRTKLRWATILKYFHPRPFYCFTVLENTEISWLFCLKLLSWILSAFILMASFFYMNRF